MPILETAHFIAALVALGLGVVVLMMRKGTAQHRWLGRTFAIAMLLVNGAALLSYEEGRFGVFHWLALLSLFTLVSGVIAIRRGKVEDHAGWVAWTWAGLSAAGLGQLVVALNLGQMAVFIAIGCTILVAYWIINIRSTAAKAARELHK